MSRFSVSFYMFKDRDMIPELDNTYIDFYDPSDEYNPFCERNFILTEELDAPAVEKAFSVVGLKWGAKYGDETFVYSHYPFAKNARRDVVRWWRDVESEVEKALAAYGTEFYDRVA